MIDDLMWYSPAPNKPAIDKLKDAVDRFKAKYSHLPDYKQPTICYVRTGMFGIENLQKEALKQFGIHVYETSLFVPGPDIFRVSLIKVKKTNDKKVTASG